MRHGKWAWYAICILNRSGYYTEGKLYETLNGLNLKRSNDVKKIYRRRSKLHAIRQKIKFREIWGVPTVITEAAPFAFLSGNSPHSCSSSGKGEQPDPSKLKLHGCVCICAV